MSINLKDRSSMFKLNSKPKKLKETKRPNSLLTLAMFKKYNNTDDIFLLLVGICFAKRKRYRQRSLERKEKSDYKKYMRLIDKATRYQTPLKRKVFGRRY